MRGADRYTSAVISPVVHVIVFTVKLTELITGVDASVKLSMNEPYVTDDPPKSTPVTADPVVGVIDVMAFVVVYERLVPNDSDPLIPGVAPE